MSEFQFIYSKETSARLDTFLSEELENFSRSKIQKTIKQGGVLINGNSIKKTGYTLRDGDEVSISFVKEKVLTEIIPDSSVKFDIIWEDDEIMIINKPIDMVVHPDSKHHEKTLVHGLLAYDESIRESGNHPLRPGIVHRLDKDVSGLMIVTKTKSAYTYFHKLFKNRNITKKYTALVHGIVKQDEGDITRSLSRSKKTLGKMVAHPEDYTGTKTRDAHTSFTVIKRFERYTLLEIQIHTGRTHQIRAHMQAFGHPIVGDSKYYIKQFSTKKEFTRMFLHASHLSFTHMDGERKEFTLEFPEKFQKFLKTLR